MPVLETRYRRTDIVRINADKFHATPIRSFPRRYHRNISPERTSFLTTTVKINFPRCESCDAKREETDAISFLQSEELRELGIVWDIVSCPLRTYTRYARLRKKPSREKLCAHFSVAIAQETKYKARNSSADYVPRHDLKRLDFCHVSASCVPSETRLPAA